MRVECPTDFPWTSIGQVDLKDSGTSPVCEGGMSNGRPMNIHWTCGLDRTVGQARSVRVGCPMDVPWTSIGQVDRKDSRIRPVCDGGMSVTSHGHPLDRWTGQDSRRA